ncbi:MAG: hypothetical protein A3K03_06075 [Bdellovibrionales bacterium RIFOXYD1_FULL_44_7]|nr:MAG: hypothetical protein A3K03_06075 [Bdellovibrionales bacterium RIFOXYD1_FULL_44_7]
MSIKDLFNRELKVVNVGLSSFRETLQELGVDSVQVDWRPPMELGGDYWPKVTKNKNEIQAANEKAIDIVLRGSAFLVGLAQARDVLPGMKSNSIFHAGPPINWERMCGPMKGAVLGALLYEGMAESPEEAEKLAASGKIEFSPCHEHNAVGPMAGIISPTMPVFIIKNETFGNQAYCTLNEGLGKVLRYGAYGPEVIKKLKWMEEILYPTLKAAVASIGKIDLKSIIAQALHMGDEVHNRNRAATSLFYRNIAPHIVKTARDKDVTVSVLDFINGNDHFFLNLSMPTSKVLLDAARNIPNSSLAVVMARNGTEFGVQLSGTGNDWFTGPAPVPDALFFAGFSKKDANPDIGDSAITETAGLGGFAIAASPAIVQFVGGSSRDSINYTLQMYEITVAENRLFQIPNLNFRGTPTGIDVLKIVEKNIFPFIDTGVAHREPGVGQVGAGVVSAPAEPFKKAAEAFVKKLN